MARENGAHWENYISNSLHFEWDMIVVTVFLSIFWTEKLSPRSYPIQFKRKWKYCFLSVVFRERIPDTQVAADSSLQVVIAILVNWRISVRWWHFLTARRMEWKQASYPCRNTTTPSVKMCRCFVCFAMVQFEHTEKSFRNRIQSTRNQIVFTIFPLFWIQMDIRLDPN